MKCLSEFLGTAALLAIVVGSGIMGEDLAQGNAGIALLANSLATGAGLFVLIQSLGPVSGAHFNPVVSLIEVIWGRMKPKEMLSYWIAQFSGAWVGVLLAHAMYGRALIQASSKVRAGSHLFLAEAVATFGLIAVIGLAGKRRVEWAPLTIAAYITSAYWFTSSTSFANPAVTLARAWTDSFCGIAPAGVPAFVLAQLLGGLAAYGLLRLDPLRVESR